MVGSRRGYLLSRGSSLEHLCDAYVVFDTWANYCTMVGSCYIHMILNRSDLGIQGYSMLTFEEYTLWLNSRWPQSGPFILWCDITVTTQEQQWTTKCVYGNASYGSLRLCFYGSLWLDFFAFAKRGLDFDWWLCDSIRNLRTNNYMLKVPIMIGSVVWRATLCRRVCFPMGAYVAGTLKQTVSLGWKSFFVLHELKGSLCHSPQALGNTSTPWQPPPLYQRKAPDGCFGEDSADVWLWFVNCTQSVFRRISNISPDQDSEAQTEACEEDYFKRWSCSSCSFPALYV